MRIRPPIGHSVRRVISLGLAFTIVACASQDSTEPAKYQESDTERLFSVGYEDISSIYIEDLSVADLAVAGIDGLGSIDPAFSAEQENGELSLYLEDVRAESFKIPADEDSDAWGHLTAMAISTSREWSSELGALEPEQVYEAVFDGILTQLDGFSRYAGREDARENRASRDGFGGIGVRIRMIEEGVLILSVMESTPAEDAGLHADDIIVAIDETPVPGMSQRDAVSRLRGPLRSRVRLKIDRPEVDDLLLVQVTRAHIIPQTVSYERIDDVGYLQVTGFNQNTTRSLKEKIRLAKSDIGDDLAGLILDLRGNPGGLLDQAVSVADLFMEGGRIVTTRGRHPDSHQYFEAEDDDPGEGMPIVVLVNGGSASASEIVASALQDSGLAVVVGSASFGKGTVQTLLRLPNQGELTLTWAQFHAPSGYGLNKRGILPDVCTSDASLTTDEIMYGVRNGTALVDRNMRSLNVALGDDATVERIRELCPASEELTDLDVEVASRLLMEPELFARALEGAPYTAGLRASTAIE